jgi:hypothetical protein
VVRVPTEGRLKKKLKKRTHQLCEYTYRNLNIHIEIFGEPGEGVGKDMKDAWRLEDRCYYRETLLITRRADFPANCRKQNN